jgi:hypothetical protein
VIIARGSERREKIMKVESILSVNSIPEVSLEGLNYKVDFGNVVLILTPLEAASLCVNLLSTGSIRAGVFESLNEGR